LEGDDGGPRARPEDAVPDHRRADAVQRLLQAQDGRTRVTELQRGRQRLLQKGTTERHRAAEVVDHGALGDQPSRGPVPDRPLPQEQAPRRAQ
jgi:hypothetical protein